MSSCRGERLILWHMDRGSGGGWVVGAGGGWWVMVVVGGVWWVVIVVGGVLGVGENATYCHVL